MAYQKYEFDEEALNKQFDTIGSSYKDMYDAQYQAAVDQLNAQLPKIEQKYDTNRANIYSNARLNALGNNEQLAAQGLGGNAYSSPVSGFSELSRTSENNALRNALARASLAQSSAENDIQTQINQAGTNRDTAYAQAMANLALQKLQAAQSERQFGANYNFNVEQAQQQMEYQKKQDALAQAQWEMATYGAVRSQAAADALGVPVGTTLSSLQVKRPSASSSRKSSSKGTQLSGGQNQIKSGNLQEAFNSGNFFLAGDGTPGQAYVFDKSNGTGLLGSVIGSVVGAVNGLASVGQKNQNEFLTDEYLKKVLGD